MGVKVTWHIRIRKIENSDDLKLKGELRLIKNGVEETWDVQTNTNNDGDTYVHLFGTSPWRTLDIGDSCYLRVCITGADGDNEGAHIAGSGEENPAIEWDWVNAANDPNSGGTWMALDLRTREDMYAPDDLHDVELNTKINSK